jgi:hypothetical protein
MARVTESTNIESPNTEWAGVAAGEKILVGDCANALLANKKKLHPTTARGGITFSGMAIELSPDFYSSSLFFSY